MSDGDLRASRPSKTRVEGSWTICLQRQMRSLRSFCRRRLRRQNLLARLRQSRAQEIDICGASRVAAGNTEATIGQRGRERRDLARIDAWRIQQGENTSADDRCPRASQRFPNVGRPSAPASAASLPSRALPMSALPCRRLPHRRGRRAAYHRREDLVHPRPSAKISCSTHQEWAHRAAQLQFISASSKNAIAPIPSQSWHRVTHEIRIGAQGRTADEGRHGALHRAPDR